MELETRTQAVSDSEESVNASELLYIDWTRFKPMANDLSDLLKTNPSLFFACLGVSSSQVRYKRAIKSQFKRLKLHVCELQVIHEVYKKATQCRAPLLKRIIRLRNYDTITPLKDIKANLVGCFVSIRGTIVRTTSILPIAKHMTFVCSSCQTQMVESFPDGRFKAPLKCTSFGCKSKTFIPDRSMQKSKSVDWQKVRCVLTDVRSKMTNQLKMKK